MRNRNVIVEFARFLFSILVVGYHVQMSMNNSIADFFENGALAVEFFFLISGYFLAKSIEKVNGRQNSKIMSETLHFMKNKIKGILPAHITATIAILLVLLVFDLGNFRTLVLKGLPGIFLVQMAFFWTNSYETMLIVPEWYLSAMLICMLFMFPIALFLRKKMQGKTVVFALVGILVIILMISGVAMNWTFPQNLIQNIRAWGDMCVGMFAYHLSAALSRLELKHTSSTALKVTEIVCYAIPIIFGFLPLDPSMMALCMVITVICVFIAISITFADKGVKITNEITGNIFSYLGSISLAIYLFHPVIISLLGYVAPDCPELSRMLIIFPAAIILAVLFNAIAGLRVVSKK
ncbi:MAG: acyltransferase [Ruminococcus sp.]|nr:acyltransferase [Ruminococcus sp.]